MKIEHFKPHSYMSVYFDKAATTPIAPEVFEVMTEIQRAVHGISRL